MTIADLGVAIRVLVGLVFAAAGVAKVYRLGRSRWQDSGGIDLARAAGFSTSRPHLAIALRILPFSEVTLAGGLLSGQLATLSLTLVGCLLLTFCVVIGRALRVGYEGPCACFGEWGDSRVGLSHIILNILFLVAVVFTIGVHLFHDISNSSMLDVTGSEALAILLIGLWLASVYWLSREVDRVMYLIAR